MIFILNHVFPFSFSFIKCKDDNISSSASLRQVTDSFYFTSMSRIFITGSSDGLGLLAARQLIREGHQVWAHARNASRAMHTYQQLEGVQQVLVGDLNQKEEIFKLVTSLNQLPTFDAVIHNAGIYQSTGSSLFHVNVVAPYLLTALMDRPLRLIYLSSGMHRGGQFRSLSEIESTSYSDTKWQLTCLVMHLSKRLLSTYVNAVDPGWVPTKMGGANAPDDLQKGYETQSWLATSQEALALTTGGYFFHQQLNAPKADVYDADLQQNLVDNLHQFTAIQLPN